MWISKDCYKMMLERLVDHIWWKQSELLWWWILHEDIPAHIQLLMCKSSLGATTLMWWSIHRTAQTLHHVISDCFYHRKRGAGTSKKIPRWFGGKRQFFLEERDFFSQKKKLYRRLSNILAEIGKNYPRFSFLRNWKFKRPPVRVRIFDFGNFFVSSRIK